jgi:ectoine hydroxylase-related dioxygenase (phytanoyl-CoA dioxygenase family)
MAIPELDGTYTISDQQKKSCNEDGFVFLKGVLNKEEVEAYRAVIDRVVHELTGSDNRPLEEKTPYEREFLQCGHLWRVYDDVKRLTLSRRLGSIGAQLLGAEHVRLWHDQALYKVPGGDGTEPHQDMSYWPMMQKNAGTIWIALDKVTVEHGALHFIPRSHLYEDIFSFENRIEDSIEKKNDLIAKAKGITGTEPVYYELEPGDATFHHSLTVHYTLPNKTNETRKGMTVIYFEDGILYDGKSPASDHHCAEGSVHGEPIATKWNPVIV